MSDLSSIVSGTFVLGSLFGMSFNWLLSAQEDEYQKLYQFSKVTRDLIASQKSEVRSQK